MIAVIDYGAGNLSSVKNALDYLGVENATVSTEEEILSADKIILPGVGAFGSAMKTLKEKKLDLAIHRAAEKKIPILGICLGMQLFFEESEESPGEPGLGLFKGKIVKIPDDYGLKIPHIGWNSLSFPKESKIFKNLGDEPYVYFVHSYYLKAEDENIVSAYTEYGENLAVAVENENIFATQFHPEKSGKTGLKILKNFIDL